MKNKKSKLIVLFIIIFLIIGVFISKAKLKFAFERMLASAKFSQEVEILYGEGFNNSIALSPKECLVASYIEKEEGLIFSVKVDGHWEKEAVDADALAGNTSSLAFNSKGEPSILYIDKDFSLNLAQKSEGKWNIEKIFDGAALSLNLVFDQEGNPNISFWSTSKGALVFGKRVAGEWQIEFLDSGRVGWWNSLALDQEQNPHISYYDFENKDLLYVFFNGQKWRKEIVDFEGDVGCFNSIALDSKNQTHISYFNETNPSLKYAKQTESGWNIETVSPKAGEKSKILLDEEENPIIFFIEGSDLKIAKKQEGNWKIRKIASGEFGDSSFLIDDKGNLHLLWQDLSQEKLKYLKTKL
jgi:hypothetical protein